MPSFDLAVPALMQFAGVWTGQSRILSSHCVPIPTSPPAKFSFASAWLRPEFMTSAEVSWTWLLTQIDVDSPEDQGPGKSREVKEMTNGKEGIMTDLASSSPM